MFFNVCLRSHSFLLCTDWQKSDSSVNREPQVNWGWNSNARDVDGYGWLPALLPFPTPPQKHPGELARRLVTIWLGASPGRSNTLIVICKCTLYLQVDHYTNMPIHTHFSTFFNTFGHLVCFSVGMGI